MPKNNSRTAYDTATYCRPMLEDFKEHMIAAAKGQQIELNPSSISIAMDQTGRLAANAAVAGIESIDMVEYERGVLSNFIFMSFEVGRLAPGFYAVTLVAPAVHLGRIYARAHIGQGREVRTILPTTLNVRALQVPLNPTTPVRTGVRFGSSFPPAEASPPDLVIDDFGDPWYCTYTDCPNGGEWCSCERYQD